MKIVKIIVPLAFVVFLIGCSKEFWHFVNEGGWPELAVVFICFGGILVCYGVALTPIVSNALAPRISGGKVALGFLSDPKSRLGYSAHDAFEGALAYLCGEVVVHGSFILILCAGSFSISLGAVVGVAVLLCWVLFFVLIVRRERKLDAKALDDPDGNPPGWLVRTD